jgi:hypothetical protein
MFIALPVVPEQARVLLPQVLPGGDQEAAGAGGRVADHVLRRRRGQRDHEPDDMPRRAELAVLPGRGDLSEHVLVDVALGVPVGHFDGVELGDNLAEEVGVRKAKAGVLHVPAVARPLIAESAQEGEDVLVDDAELLARLKVFEPGPAKVVVGPLDNGVVLRVVAKPVGECALWEDAARHRLAEGLSLVLLKRV